MIPEGHDGTDCMVLIPGQLTADALRAIVTAAKCCVCGWEEASNDGHRLVLAALIRGADEQTTLLCEPSLARRTNRPPDIVVIDARIGIHVVEVKGGTLDQIEAVEPGGQFRIRYDNGIRTRSPFAQARSAMFDIKDAVERSVTGELVLPFKYWVVMPRISRAEWLNKWGDNAFCPPELIFSDDLSALASRMTAAGQRQLSIHGIERCPEDQLQCLGRAFGDTSILYPKPEDRQPRPVSEGTLGEFFDEQAELYKALSDEQQRLLAQNWNEGPRLVRGVAGSGKTIVLAGNLARRLERQFRNGKSALFETNPPPRILAVCFNHSLVPYIRKKIEIAYQQRTGKPLPESGVEVFCYNRLMWHLGSKGLWRYQRIVDSDDATRAAQYLKELEFVKVKEPVLFDTLVYDAIYIDEGQDFLEEDFRLLKGLCRTVEGGEPNLYVFYDDAQNLYGRKRPNWQSVGLNIRGGRAHVMIECFRNTRQIVEPTFNVLYGTFAATPGQVPTKEYGDIATLREKKVIGQVDGTWKVDFAKRTGMKPRLTMTSSRSQETAAVLERIRWLTEEQEVRPEDIQVLSFTRDRVLDLAAAIEKAKLRSLRGIHVPWKDRDNPLGRRGHLSVSTVASAKGYDAFCVLLASANEFNAEVMGRVSFYVGCTRAIEYLEMFAYERKGLVGEMETALANVVE